MKGRRFRIFCIFLLALLCVSCSRVTEDEEREKEYITIGFSQVGSESDWRSANSISMRETFSERNGYELFLSEAQQKQDRDIGSQFFHCVSLLYRNILPLNYINSLAVMQGQE